jgi:choline dehydrogenase
VAIIEPGTDQRNNPNVTDPDLYRAALGTDIDWQYHTVAQAGASNRVLRYSQGKAIGGTSTINGAWLLGRPLLR